MSSVPQKMPSLVELFGCDLLAQRMERFDLVPGQVEQADLLQVAERLGDLPEFVVGRIEDLELLLRWAVGDGVEPLV